MKIDLAQNNYEHVSLAKEPRGEKRKRETERRERGRKKGSKEAE